MSPRSRARIWVIATLGFPLLLALPAVADNQASTLVHMLGYIGVDYPETVKYGKVVDAGEYAEQREFAGRVRTLLAELPEAPQKPQLLRQAEQLAGLIDARGPGEKVALLTEQMRDSLVTAYRIAVAPRRAPDLARGAKLFAAQCSSCHGLEGRGDGPAARGMDPAPVDFHDAARQSQRSVHALYNATTLGVPGTAMQAYASQLNDDDRWALALHVANLLATDSQRQAGEKSWSQDPRYARYFTSLDSVTRLSPRQAVAEFGSDGAAVLAWLRSVPETALSKESPLAFSARKMEESLALYRSGRFEAAYSASVTAYLEGFELAESGLKIVKPAIKQDVEREMYAYRALIKARGADAEVSAAAARVQALLSEAQKLLEGAAMSPAMAYTSSLVILLREGLEAILLLAVVVAFLIKTDRRSAIKYIHAGWLAALLLGIATWAVAAYVVEVSGASREMTEGVTALLAAAILLYVGFWLHDKMHARRWKEFIEDRVHGALSSGTLWGIALVAFIAVYREVFETVLFYQALWLQAGDGGHNMVLAGFLSAALLLVVLSWLIFRFSVRLPLRLFFGINSALLYLLAIVFAGKGIAALQEAGKLPVDPVSFPRIDLLGIYPNLQGLLAQAALLILAAVILWTSSSRGRTATAT